MLWFYGRVLLAPSLHLPTFRRLQEALGIGDVVIVGLGLHAWGTLDAAPAMLAAQIGMAALWGLVRVAFLVKVRAPA